MSQFALYAPHLRRAGFKPVEQRRDLRPVAKVNVSRDERTRCRGRQFSERQQIHARQSIENPHGENEFVSGNFPERRFVDLQFHPVAHRHSRAIRKKC